MIDIRAHRQKMTGDEPDAKAILPKRGASRKQIPISCRLKLEDADGFRAALGNVITDVARERGMWGQKPVDCEEADETE